MTPWILIDELIYSDLARSLGDEGTLSVRGEPIAWSNFGYVMIAPAWLLTEAQSTAYFLAKTINVGLGVSVSRWSISGPAASPRPAMRLSPRA